MTFDESLDYLLSLGNEVSAMKLGLDNIRKLLASLGNPEKNYLKVQVAGTNGKGSVCAFLDAICVSAGIETGLFTSPHLVSITERIKINGREVSEDDFARHAIRVRETAEKLLDVGDLEYRPTFFEQVTAIALTAFAETGVELAILETGLGGRLDATTAANAEIAAITRIDLDHQEYLGATIEEIAAEKAAIIHAGSKVVIAEQKPEAMEVVTSVCAKLGVAPSLAEKVVAATAGRNTSGSECVKTKPSLPVGFLPQAPIDFLTGKGRYKDVRIGLLGRHQIENAKVAILLAEILQEYFDISTENIIDGLQTAANPGRLEFKDNFLFDGAHNPAGAKALRSFLDEFVQRPIVIVFGSMKDKDINEFAEILFRKADTLILTQPKNPRALSAAEIVETLSDSFDKSRTVLTEGVETALGKAREIGGDEKLILVTGSLYLVGEAKKILQNEPETGN